jgi:hypothetical protein
VELVDTLDLGSSAARCESSSLSACTNLRTLLTLIVLKGFFFNICMFFILLVNFEVIYFINKRLPLIIEFFLELAFL